MSPLRAVRICRAQHSDTAFTGDGGKRAPGRWHSIGTAIVYCASSQAGAQLELLVNLRGVLNPTSFVFFEVSFDQSLVAPTITAKDLDEYPVDWRNPQYSVLLQEMGDEWARSLNSAVMAVPSAVTPADFNYLLNPQHPDFKKIKIGKPQAVVWDPRLLERLNPRSKTSADPAE